MGAAKSTSRTNGTNQEEEERKQKSSIVVRAAATIAVVGLTAWVISDSTYTQEEEEVVEAVATIAAVGLVAWGISRMLLFLVKMISRMLFDNTDTQENESAMKMKMIAESSYVPEGFSQTSDATWSPPPHGRLKLNTDGTCRPDEVNNNTNVDLDGDSVKRGPAGYGGILRDHNGKWRRGFTGYIGVTDILTAELHGILKGLEFLDKLRYKGAILETDNEAAYKWLIQPYKKCSKSQIVKDSWPIIEKCRQLVAKNNIKINDPVTRRANKCADKLADVAIDHENKVKYMEIEDLPDEILAAYLTDRGF